jgi:hypothetical protein
MISRTRSSLATLVSSSKRHIDIGKFDGLRVASVGVAHDAHARIAGEHAFQPRAAASVPSATITWPAWML